MRAFLIFCGIVVALYVSVLLSQQSARHNADAATKAGSPSNQPPALAPADDVSTYFIDHPVRLHHPFYGCAKQDDLDSVKAMQRAQDVDAMVVAANRGGCTELQIGDRGTVMDHSVWHASTCLRRHGEPDCLWVPDAVLEKDAPAKELAIAKATEGPPVGSRAVDNIACVSTTDRLTTATRATFDSFSPHGDNVFLRHPAARDIVLSCAPYQRMAVSLAVSTGRPSSDFFALAASAGAIVTGQPAARVAALLKRCHVKAHRSTDESDEEDLTHIEVDCSSFDRDGGGTAVTISVGKDDPIIKP